MSAPIHIGGTTRLYAIVGDPIVQVRSAEVFSQRFAAAGFDAVLVAMQVPLERHETVIPALMALGNLDGLLVTIPYKDRLTRYADRLGAAAACIGAVNALRREDDGSWSGDMFDGAGYVCGVRNKGERLDGRHALLFGAGGAGSAIACALAQAQVASIRIAEPDAARGQRLLDALRRAFPQLDAGLAGTAREGFDLVLNASPVGMRDDDGLPGDIGPLQTGTLVGDVVVRDEPTAIVRAAMAHGCAWTSGRDMHAGQADAIMDFFAAPLNARARAR
jgi:shikimate dehydrogenase